jgi:hypothetical protein
MPGFIGFFAHRFRVAEREGFSPTSTAHLTFRFESDRNEMWYEAWYEFGEELTLSKNCMFLW